jgi:peptide/nickel transport system substrate-binding protein
MVNSTTRARSVTRTVAASVATVALGIALAGCADGTSTSTDTTSTPTSGGTLRVGVGEGLICVDPHQIYTYEGWAVTSAISDSLTALDPETNEIVPWLASEWSVNEDSTAYTFTLRDDVTFSDGTPLNAEVVKANLDDTVENLAGSAGAPVFLAGYESTTVDDTYTATVHFSAPNPAFLIGSSTPTISMVGLSTLALTPDERCQGGVVGTGPFVLDSFRPGEGATLVRRDGYDWSSAASEHSGEAYLDGIEFTIVSSGSVREGQLTSGQLDVAWGVGTQSASQLESAGATVIRGTVPGMPMSLLANTVEGRILSDASIRQALQIAFDRADTVAAASNGEYRAPTSVLTAGMYGWADESAALAFDPDAANEILDEAGWEMQSDGIREKDGVRLTVDLAFSEDLGPVYAPSLTLVQEQARAVGIELVLSPTTAAGLSQGSVDGTYDLMSTSITQSDPNVLALVVNYILLDKPLLEAEGILDLLAASGSAPNGPERESALADLQAALIDSALIIPVFEQIEIAAAAAGVGGLSFDSQAKLQFYDTWTRS